MGRSRGTHRGIVTGFTIVTGFAFAGVLAFSTSAHAFDASRAKEHIETIAADAFEGRKSGLAGGVMVEEYLAAQFEEYGLEPGGTDETYYQQFPMIVTDEKAAAITLLDGPLGEVPLVLGEDFMMITNSGSGDVEAEAVIVGHGLSKSEWEWDDYKDVDIEGKIALIVRGRPDNGYDWARYARRDSSMKEAMRRGAAAVVWLPSSHPVNGAAISEASYAPDVPCAYVAERLFRLLLRDTGYSVKSYKEALKEGPTPLATGKRLRFTANVERMENGHARNAIGLVRGTDPVLATEYVVVGGHMDHVGIDGNGTIYNGANDNASGTSVVLELARLFAKNPPRRSMLFMGFAGEEQGLLGSKYFAENPTRSIDDIAAMFNFDMVGHGNGDVGVGGGEFLPDVWRSFARDIDSELDSILHAGIAWEGESSDHAPFRNRGVPVFTTWSAGDHLFYHLFDDDASWINEDALHAVGGTAEKLIGLVANWDDALIPRHRKGRMFLTGALQADFDGTHAESDHAPYRFASVDWCPAQRFGKNRFALDLSEKLRHGEEEDSAGVASSLKGAHSLAKERRHARLAGIEGTKIDDLAPDWIPLLGKFDVAIARWPGFVPKSATSARGKEEKEFFSKVAGQLVDLLIGPEPEWLGVLPESGRIFVRADIEEAARIKDPEGYPLKGTTFVISIDKWIDPGRVAEQVHRLGKTRTHIDVVPWLANGLVEDVAVFFEELQTEGEFESREMRMLLGRNLVK